ncbi:hypothetical protein ACHQM5_016053 [Ranunculus cassubicifolius]
MRNVKEEPTWIIDQPIDILTAVEELHGLGSQDLNKLLKDSENFVLQLSSEDGSKVQVDVERLARCLPVHLIAVLVSSGGQEDRMPYLLNGFRLLHTFSDLAPRHSKLEQILLEDVRVTEQIMDLIFYTIVVLARYKQVYHAVGLFPIMHSALVACSLHLLTGYISSQWKDLVQVLVAHPEVDLFMDAAFNAVRIDIVFLQIKLSAIKNGSSSSLVELSTNSLCQHCETSLQFLQSLCQQKLFRERLLRSTELCKNGGILSLVKAILGLYTPPCNEASKVAAALSRMKSKVLSILLQLCETESISYLDEVASSPSSMLLAKFVALEVLKLLKTAFGRNKQLSDSVNDTSPRGLVLLNTMRLVDIFSDDSNFRYFIIINTTHILVEMLLLPHEEFLTSWCSADLPVVEVDASLDYDPFVATGAALGLLSVAPKTTEESIMECTFNLNRLPQASYAQHRASLLVKIIANLHCFVPNICEEQERNLFFNKFIECLRRSPNPAIGSIVCKNLGFLLEYAASLIPTFLNEEDVHLLSNFYKDFLGFFTVKVEGNLSQEQDQGKKPQDSHVRDNFLISNVSESNQGHATRMDPTVRGVSVDHRKSDYPMEGTSESLSYQEKADNTPLIIETSGSEGSSTRDKESLDQLLDKSEDPNGEEKQQRRKRKRSIMNENQVTVIERAATDEPDMIRNAGWLQTWADKLSDHGPQITPGQLKNWLNNRKAKLARASRETSQPTTTAANGGGGGGLSLVNYYDSPESDGEEFCAPSKGISVSKYIRFKPGQYVCLLDKERKEIGKGKVFQVEGIWQGNVLEEIGSCVVDIIELKVERRTRLQYPSDVCGLTFEEAEAKIGVMRVVWDAKNIIKLPK